MVFTSPEWCIDLPVAPPDSIPICDFILNETYGRHALDDSKPPYTCGLSGKEYSALQVKDRVENLAKAIGKDLGWTPNQGNEWEKVVGVYSLNTVREDGTHVYMMEDRYTMVFGVYMLGVYGGISL